MLGKVVQGLGRFLQIVYLHPAFQAGATTLQAGLNVHKQIDLAVHVQIDFLPLGQLRFADPLLQSFQCIISAQCFGTGKAFLTLGTEFQYLLTLDNLVTFLSHCLQKFIECTDLGQNLINGLAQTGFPAFACFLSRPFCVVLAFVLGFLDDVQTKLLADTVIDFSQRNEAILHIVELVGAVQGGAVKLDMIMNVVFVNVGSHNELVFAVGKLHGYLIAQLVGVLRRDGSRLKGLYQQIGNHIFVRGTSAPGGSGVNLLADHKFLPRSIGRTLVACYQQTTVCFLRVLVIVNAIRQHSSDTASLAGMTGFDF